MRGIIRQPVQSIAIALFAFRTLKSAFSTRVDCVSVMCQSWSVYVLVMCRSCVGYGLVVCRLCVGFFATRAMVDSAEPMAKQSLTIFGHHKTDTQLNCAHILTPGSRKNRPNRTPNNLRRLGAIRLPVNLQRHSETPPMTTIKITSALTAVLLFVSLASAGTVEQGRFGRGITVGGDQYVAADYNPVYALVPMTVEFWAKVPEAARKNPNVLIAAGPKNSRDHWDVFSEKTSGNLAGSLPGFKGGNLKSDKPIADGQWHFIALTLDEKNAKLFLDGKEVCSQAVVQNAPYPDVGPLAFGYIDGVPSAADTLIDEVRISRVIRATNAVPEGPFKSDADTLGLWHFDEDAAAYDKAGYADVSAIHNHAHAEIITRDSLHNGFDNSVGGKTKWSDMDYGPFFSSSLGAKKNVTYKAVSVQLNTEKDKAKQAAVAFDTELMRYSVGWTGGFLALNPGREGLAGHPNVDGAEKFATTATPGCSSGENADDFKDPRPDQHGPLPAEWAKYKGLYRNGQHVVFSYSVNGMEVLDCPGYEAKEFSVFTRTIEVGAAKGATKLVVCELAAGVATVEGNFASVQKDKTLTQVVLTGGDSGATLSANSGRILLGFPAAEKVRRIKLVIATATPEDAAKLHAALEETAKVAPEELAALTRGGPANYPQAVATVGTLGKEDPKKDNAYVVDTLTAPDDNPWKSFLRFGGHDFFSNGDAAVCSISGDVWVVSGIDDKLDHLQWRRFATGLFQPLGLKIVKDEVYVLGRDQITRLHDLNKDGEADFYENFNNDCKVTENGHAYTTNLETDADGNFYYCKCADGTAHGGTVLKVDRYGKQLDVVATGIRNSNGLGASATGVITEADNEGEWVPASRIDLVKQGTFLGFEPSSHRTPAPTDPGKPIVWMPQNCDNSSGGQFWVEGDKWGPFKNEMFHSSYGMACIFHVMTEEVNGVTQGGVFRFPLHFDTGVMRGRFRPQDGQLYVSGLRGWQTSGAKNGALQRVRYTGKPVHMPAALHVHANGILLTYTSPLDAKAAADAESYSVQQWNYHWSRAYGSAHWSVNEPTRQGQDILAIKSAHVSKDGLSVFLEVPGIQPVMQMMITANLTAADGTNIRNDIWNTIHNLGPAFNVESLK